MATVCDPSSKKLAMATWLKRVGKAVIREQSDIAGVEKSWVC